MRELGCCVGLDIWRWDWGIGVGLVVGGGGGLAFWADERIGGLGSRGSAEEGWVEEGQEGAL